MGGLANVKECVVEKSKFILLETDSKREETKRLIRRVDRTRMGVYQKPGRLMGKLV